MRFQRHGNKKKLEFVAKNQFFSNKKIIDNQIIKVPSSKQLSIKGTVCRRKYKASATFKE